jgi:beta-galactosidase
VPPAPPGLAADASFSGAEETPPALMIDGDPATSWSNAYAQPATALLPAISAARPRDWVSVTLPAARTLTGATVRFVVDAQHTLPATITVRYRDGGNWRTVPNPVINASDGTITFPGVRATALRLDLTSAHPGAADGSLAIAELSIR